MSTFFVMILKPLELIFLPHRNEFISKGADESCFPSFCMETNAYPCRPDSRRRFLVWFFARYCVIYFYVPGMIWAFKVSQVPAGNKIALTLPLRVDRRSRNTSAKAQELYPENGASVRPFVRNKCENVRRSFVFNYVQYIIEVLALRMT